MRSANTVERLLEVATRVVDPNRRATLTPASLLFEDKLLDSFGILQLVAEIETEFAISIRTDDLTVQNFSAITAIVLLVDGYLAAGG